MECPYCAKELQVRGMFSHIRKFHNEELLKNTSQRWIDDAMTGQPLRVWWSMKNDFDEEVETVIYVCLSSNKTFTSQPKAMEHFKKDKAALKEHNKQLKELKKLYTQHRKEETKKKKVTKTKEDPSTLRFMTARASNDPELARSIWRGILNNKTTLEICKTICLRRGYEMETSMYFFDKKQKMMEQIPFSQFMIHYNVMIDEVDRNLESQCLNVKVLMDLYFRTLGFWQMNFTESLMNLNEDLRILHPLFNIILGDDKFYGYATEEMKGVDF